MVAAAQRKYDVAGCSSAVAVRLTVSQIRLHLRQHGRRSAALKALTSPPLPCSSHGVQVHCLRSHVEPNRLQFLPYHFLLASVGNAGGSPFAAAALPMHSLACAGYLKFQDVSTGQLVAEHRTKYNTLFEIYSTCLTARAPFHSCCCCCCCCCCCSSSSSSSLLITLLLRYGRCDVMRQNPLNGATPPRAPFYLLPPNYFV